MLPGLGQVLHTVRVQAQVIQFLGWPFAEAEVPVPFLAGLGAALQHLRFGGTAVGVEVAGLGVAHGPAVGGVVVQVQVLALDDAPDGVACVVGPPHVVPLLADQQVVAGRVHLPALFRIKDVGQAPPCNRLQARLLRVYPGQLQVGGRKVDEAHQVLHPSPRLHDAVFPHDGQRHVAGHFVLAALGPGERHAVVGGDDHDGVVQLPRLLQQLQHLAQMTVEVLDLEGVVEHVGAHGVVRGPVGRHPVNV